MQLHHAKFIVRAAAVVAFGVSLYLLGFLGLWIYESVAFRSNSPRFLRELLVYGLFAIVPCMFIWASVQAWRFIPKGILSIYSGYLLFGFMGSFVTLFHLIFSRAWSHTAQDAMGAVISLSMFAIVVLVASQEGRFKKDAA